MRLLRDVIEVTAATQCEANMGTGRTVGIRWKVIAAALVAALVGTITVTPAAGQARPGAAEDCTFTIVNGFDESVRVRLWEAASDTEMRLFDLAPGEAGRYRLATGLGVNEFSAANNGIPIGTRNEVRIRQISTSELLRKANSFACDRSETGTTGFAEIVLGNPDPAVHDCSISQDGNELRVDVDNPDNLQLGINIDQQNGFGYLFGGRVTDSFTFVIPPELDPGQYTLDLRSRRSDGSPYATVGCGRFDIGDGPEATCSVRDNGDGTSTVTVLNVDGGFINVRSVDDVWIGDLFDQREMTLDGIAGSVILRNDGLAFRIPCTPSVTG